MANFKFFGKKKGAQSNSDNSKGIDFTKIKKKNAGDKSIVSNAVLNSGNIGNLSMSKQDQAKLKEERSKIPTYVKVLKITSIVMMVITMIVIPWIWMDSHPENVFLEKIGQPNTGKSFRSLNISITETKDTVNDLKEEKKVLTSRIKNEEFFENIDLISRIKSYQKNWYTNLSEFRYIIYDANTDDLATRYEDVQIFPPVEEVSEKVIYWFPQSLETRSQQDDTTIITLQLENGKPIRRVFTTSETNTKENLKNLASEDKKIEPDESSLRKYEDAIIEALKGLIIKDLDLPEDRVQALQFKRVSLPKVVNSDEDLTQANQANYVLQPIFTGYGLLDLFIPSTYSIKSYFNPASQDYNILYFKETDTDSQFQQFGQRVSLSGVNISDKSINVNVELTNYEAKKFTYVADLIQVMNSLPIFEGAEVKNYLIQTTQNNTDGMAFPLRLNLQDPSVVSHEDQYQSHFKDWFIPVYLDYLNLEQEKIKARQNTNQLPQANSTPPATNPPSPNNDQTQSTSERRTPTRSSNLLDI